MTRRFLLFFMLVTACNAPISKVTPPQSATTPKPKPIVTAEREAPKPEPPSGSFIIKEGPAIDAFPSGVFAFVVATAAIAIIGCSGASDCDAIASKARDEVGKAIDAHKTCTTNADCVEISFGTSCFDSCSRGLANGGVADVDAAKASAEKNACASFKEKGCKLIVPPCAPPALRCEKGSCET